MNATKYDFGVSSEKFLRHLVTWREIEGNPKQITVINNLVIPRTAKKVQKLTGIEIALNRFISKSLTNAIHFFNNFTRTTNFYGTRNASSRFNNLRNT